MHRNRIYLFSLLALLFSSTTTWSAETIRVGFPSLATGFAPSWVAADKAIWKKHGLDVDMVQLAGAVQTPMPFSGRLSRL